MRTLFIEDYPCSKARISSRTNKSVLLPIYHRLFPLFILCKEDSILISINPSLRFAILCHFSGTSAGGTLVNRKGNSTVSLLFPRLSRTKTVRVNRFWSRFLSIGVLQDRNPANSPLCSSAMRVEEVPVILRPLWDNLAMISLISPFLSLAWR